MDRIESAGDHTRLCEHSPQLPQGFTPVQNITFWPGQPPSHTCFTLNAPQNLQHPSKSMLMTLT